MIKVIYCVDGKSSQYSGSVPPVVGAVIADTYQEAEEVAEHLRNSLSGVRISIVGQPGCLRVPPAKLPHDFKTHEHSWIGALERLIEIEPDRDERIYWEHELKAMRNAYSVLRGEKEDD